ncbi:MAG: YdcF family protein [Candidatus Binatia bacterium]
MRLGHLLVIGSVLALAAAGTLAGAGRFLVVADPLPAHADAIVVMAGAVPDRALEAADLYRTGVAPRIVITRERRRRGYAALLARGVRLPESDELLRTALTGLGVPDTAVVLLRRRNRSTESEARTIARWACRHAVRTMVVVTSRAHTRRTRIILRQALPPGIGLAVRPSRWDGFSSTRWWRVRHDAKIVLAEWEKLAHHWSREHWSIPRCGGLRPPSASAAR